MATLFVALALANGIVLSRTATCPQRCSCYRDTNAFCYNTSLEDIAGGFSGDLEFFTLNGGHQSVLRNGTFAGTNLDGVRVMALLRSGIATIQPAAFRGMEELAQLDLSYNRLRHLHPDAFPPDLNTLILSSNPLAVPTNTPFLNIAMLSHLYIQNSNLTRIPEQMFVNMRLLSGLELNGNLIYMISPNAFRSLSRLQHVDLSHNKLQSLPPESFEYNWELTYVNLDNNLLNVPGDTALFNSASLKVLHVSLNNITFLGGNTFKHFRNLNILHINNNTIRNIKKSSFSDLRNLKYVDFSHNRIKHIPPDTFNNNLKLKTLVLSGNPLDVHAVVPFLCASKLEILVLRFCNISALPQQSFQSTPMLREIDLSHNLLEYADATLFEKQQHLSTVTLSGTPFACSCHKRELRARARELQIRVVSTCIVGGRTKRVNCASRYPDRAPIWGVGA